MFASHSEVKALLATGASANSIAGYQSPKSSRSVSWYTFLQNITLMFHSN